MIDLRDMRLITALARHRHFARAAEECGISQPAFSMRLRNLEADLGVPVVRRGNRYEGFTEEGEMLLIWARKLLDDVKVLEQEVRSVRGSVSGKLSIGCVPTALAWTSQLPPRLRTMHSQIGVRIHSQTSLEIQRGIEDGTLDVGVTYLDGTSADFVDIHPLYDETYVLLVSTKMAPRETGTATWREAAELPLSLLVPEMQNRRILDRTFADLGLVPNVISEANVFSVSQHQVRSGFAATIVPDALAIPFADNPDIVVLPLVEPSVRKAMCLITGNRNPVTPAVRVLLDLLR
ncbi:LysR family transcriptional regulator [Amaricoccus tamworthensis]|uniref:LysR family transcriptional regulator n=1 Tax=Amaricoccus tamworthensis TaxID=57002 RepID=UPI003C7C59E3